ncbi:serine hydrolase domain-containing protein [Phycicoccus avicenniae]|uniref:serine hydrolase domain-containing protein n=1 Tax=Phycicoccus avicenniae TaxID=2828860 RepID=UPI003D2BE5AD
MTSLDTLVDRMLGLGHPGRHPAGAVVGVRSPTGSEVAAGGWALLPADGTDGVPMGTASWLDWASVTKAAATTVLVLRLVETGALDLDDPVAWHLPAFTRDGRDAVRLEHLLTHTAGLPPWAPLYCRTTDRDEALAHLVTAAPRSAPGTQWVYSDLGMVLAGAVVEQVAGARLDDAFRSLVAEPMGLGLGFGPAPEGLAAASADSDVVEWTMVATGRPYPVDGVGPGDFDGWRRGPVRGEANDGNAAHALGGVAGHAGLFGPVEDLLALGAALCDSTLVRPDLLARCTRPTAAHPAQGLGFRFRDAPGPDGGASTWLWHGGFTGTVWALDPRTRAVVAGGATRLHGTTGPLPVAADGHAGPGDHPDPLEGLATGEELAALVLSAASPSPEEPAR